MVTSFNELLAEVHACTLCEKYLPQGVRPVLQIHPKARLVIVGQAPGRKVHQSGIPFDVCQWRLFALLAYLAYKRLNK